jgi:hypothetical protein
MRGARWLARLGPLALGLLAIAFATFQERNETARRTREEAAAGAARRAERRPVFARSVFGTVLDLCRADWRDELSLYHEPSALAWTRRGLDGYFLEGDDLRSWRHVSCDEEGVRRGRRVVHPFLASLVEATAEAANLSAVPEEEAWSLALARLSTAPEEPLELAIEVVRHPFSGEVLVRRWRGVEGVRPSLEPAGTPPFPLLVAEPAFPFAPGAQPPPLRPLARHDWLAETDAAFAVVEKALPAGARIVELTIQQDAIDVSVESPTPAFDDDPPAPYGDLGFDEYGIADSSWWYPRTDPGFGCRTGKLLAEVRAAYDAARRRTPGTVYRAWYSCSPAYSDGSRGAWHLVD